MRKHTVIILNQLNIKNNKINKDNLKKKTYKKIMWRNIVAIHSVLKKKNYETKFSTSSI
jgi:arginine decarboxylase-like protein